MHVCTYICIVKLETALQSRSFKSEQHKAGLNLLYSAWWLKTEISKVLKPFDLTQEQYNVMRILNGKHPETMCVKDIACRMIEKNSNVPRIIDRLVAKMWVTRTTSAEDKRETLIGLTAAGIAVLKDSTVELDNALNAFIQLSQSEAFQLNELLEKLRQGEE